MIDIHQMKRAQMEAASEVRKSLCKKPDLSWLFFELTTRCNLQCRHCGSQCSSKGLDMDPQWIRKALRELDPELVMIALTGGEPMLHPDFYEIGKTITALGFRWGMTSNAVLINDAAADRLKQAGMRTISVSLDGLAGSHDALRRKPGAWEAAMSGIRALQNAGFRPQVTTVVHPGNLGELPELHERLKAEKVASWRITNVDPIGRARDSGLLLPPQAFRELLGYIRELHLHGEMEVTYGCAHYLGIENERMVRNHYFFCGAGITVAGIRANGDICACLDIENRPELVQGNIGNSEFADIWQNRFEPFRTDRTARSAKCSVCPDRTLCCGDSMHTWDFDANEPLLCGKEYMTLS